MYRKQLWLLMPASVVPTRTVPADLRWYGAALMANVPER